jgi:hypothetical protein
MRTVLQNAFTLTILTIIGVLALPSLSWGQNYDLAIEAITVPSGTITTRDVVNPTALVLNLGPQPSQNFGVMFEIRAIGGALVYGPVTRAVPGIPPNPTQPQEVVSATSWKPANPGNYIVRAWITGVADLNRQDDTAMGTVNVAPAFLTRQEAKMIADTAVINKRPNASTVVAYLYNGTGPDSILQPGSKVIPWDSGFTETLTGPAYLIWVDNDPTLMWLHSSSFIFVNAITGATKVNEADSWPIVNDIEITPQTFSPGPHRGSNPVPAATVYQYESVTTTNTNDWALIIVGRNFQDWDASALASDVARIKECLNGAALGPKVSGPNIKTVGIAPDGTIGASEEEVCDAIKALKDLPTPCSKIYVHYVGHGYNGGMVLHKANKKGSDHFSYKDLACKLLEANPQEVCIVIMACHSGSAVAAITGKKVGDKKTGVKSLKGSIVTSSTAGKTTTGAAGGSPFTTAMNACCKDPGADLDKDGHVSNIEAVNWARARNPTVAADDPQVAVFGDGRTRVLPGPVTTGFNNNEKPGDGGGSLDVEITKVYYRLDLGDKPKNDSVYCRRYLYFVNPGVSPRTPNKNVQVICTRKVKVGKGYRLEETVLQTITANLGNKERRCVGEVPEGCSISFKDVKRRAAKDSDPVVDLLPAAGEATFYRYKVLGAIYTPKDFVFIELPVLSDTSQQHTATVSGPAGWGLDVSPASFTTSPFLPDPMIVVRGALPDTATEGGTVLVHLVNTTLGDTVEYRIEAFLYDSLDAAITSGARYRYRALDNYNDISVAAGSVQLDHSVVRMNGPRTVQILPAGELQMRNTSIGNDSAASFTMRVFGKLVWEASVLNQPSDGLVLDSGANVDLLEGGIISSRADGLLARGSMANVRIGFLHIDSSARNGVRGDATRGLILKGVTIEHSVGPDVSLLNESEMRLRDCSFDASKVSVQHLCTLIREWTSYFIFVDSAGNYLSGVKLELRDGTGAVIGRDTTTANGYSQEYVLPEWRQDGTERATYGAYQLRINYMGKDTVVTHRADREINREIVLTPGVVGVDREESLTGETIISAIHPNPLDRGDGLINFTLRRPSDLSLRFYDVTGHEVLVRSLGWYDAGEHSAAIDISGLPSGTYVYELSGGSGTSRGKVVRR